MYVPVKRNTYHNYRQFPLPPPTKVLNLLWIELIELVLSENVRQLKSEFTPTLTKI